MRVLYAIKDILSTLGHFYPTVNINNKKYQVKKYLMML